MTRLRRLIDTVLGWVVAALLGALVLDVLWQVFTRFALRSPSSFTEELARYLLVWVGLLGAAWAGGQQMHLGIDVLATRLPPGPREAARRSASGLVACFAVGVLVVGGLRLVSVTLALGQTSAALGLQLGWVYLALPVSGLLIAFYAIGDLLHTPAAPAAPPEAD